MTRSKCLLKSAHSWDPRGIALLPCCTQQQTQAQLMMTARCPGMCWITHPGVGLDAGIELADLEQDAEHAAPGDMRVRVARLQLHEDDLRQQSVLQNMHLKPDR